MNFKNLYIVVTFKDTPEKYAVEGVQKNVQTGNNELLVTIFDQKIWFDATKVKLYKGRGSTFCWKDFEENRYIELNDQNDVCPVCGWWICHYCKACRCNYHGKKAKQSED